MLKKLVEDYMRSEWVNKGIDIGYYAAKAKLLKGAKIMFFEPYAVIPKWVFADEDLDAPLPLPVIADANGDFNDMHLNGNYSIHVLNRFGECLLIIETDESFKIEA